MVPVDPPRPRDIPSATGAQCPQAVRRSSPGAPQHVINEVDLNGQQSTTLSALRVSATLSGAQLSLRGSTSPILYFHSEHSAMICVPCGRRVGVGRSFESHFRNVHRLKGQEFLDTLAFSRQVTAVNETAPLPNQSPIIPHLHLFHGFECLGCGFLTGSLACRRLHGNKCPIVQDLNPSWRSVDLQSWSTGRYADYWIVRTLVNV